MAINTDPTLTKDILKPINLPVVEPEQPVVEEPVIEDPSQITEPMENQPLSESITEEVQVAGKLPINQIVEMVSDYTSSTRDKVYNKVQQKDLVADMGNFLVVRPADDMELTDLVQGINKGDPNAPGINFFDLGENFTTDDSLKFLFAFDQKDTSLASFMQNVADKNKELFKKASRDKVSIETQIKLAEKFGQNELIIKMLSRKPGEVLPAEDTLGAIIGLVNWSKMTQQHVQKAIDKTGKTAEQIKEDHIIALRFISLQSQLSASLSGNVSEGGRLLSTMRHINKITQSGDFSKYADELHSILGKKFETIEDMDEALNYYIRLEKHQQLDYGKKLFSARASDSIIEIWMNSILSSPISHMVNMGGNEIFSHIKLNERGLAGIIGAVRTKIPGQPSDRVYIREMASGYYGKYSSLWDAIVLASRTLVTEQTGIEATKIDARNMRSIGKTGNIAEIVKNATQKGDWLGSFIDILGVSVRMSSRFLITEDEFFRVSAMGSAKRMEAKRIQIDVQNAEYKKEIAKGLNHTEAEEISIEKAKIAFAKAMSDPSQSTMNTVTDYAKELTFTKDLQGFLASAQPIMNHPLIKMYVPFFKTPVNIFTEVFDRTLPFNVYKKFHTGTGREKDEALAKLIMGWGIGLAWWKLVAGQGDDAFFCTGSGPSQSQAKKAMLRQKILPYSCTFTMEDGTMRSVTYSRLDPVSGLLAIASDFNYYMQYESDEGVLTNLRKSYVLAMADYVDQHPMMQGLAEIANIITDKHPNISAEDRYERFEALMTEKVGSIALSPASSSFFSYLERINDPTASSTLLPPGENVFGDTYTEMPPYMIGFYTALQKAKSKNPFWANDEDEDGNRIIPTAKNLWYEERMQGMSRGWEYWSPLKIMDAEFNDVDEEIMRLGNLGTSGPRMPYKKLSGTLLNNKEYDDYIKYINRVDEKGYLPDDVGYDRSTTMLRSLKQLIRSEEYRLTRIPEDKMDLIMDIVSERKKFARIQLIDKHIRLARIFKR